METMVREASARPWAQPLCKRWTAHLSLSFNKASDVSHRFLTSVGLSAHLQFCSRRSSPRSTVMPSGPMALLG